jgi:GntR family transcriptional regulator, transcriptional repressor for pyruvate dehydrogenase complex
VALSPVSRRSVPDAVFDQLATDILGGELSPGTELPAERRLAEVLGVSRPAVREALQRLAQAGLIDVRQGDATTVRDYRRTAGPELLPRLLAGDGTPDLEVVRHILEARFALMPDIARRAAQRRSADDLARMHELVGRMEEQLEDLPALQRTAHELFSAIVDGSGNVVYRLLFNALEAAYLPAMDALAQIFADELTDPDTHRELVDAIDRGNGAQAAAIGRRLIGIGTAAAMAAINQLQAG